MTVIVDHDVDELPESLKPYGVDFQNGRRLRFSYPPSKVSSGEILAAIQDAGLGIVDLTTREAELEDIFLKLTGRPERDGG